MKEQGEPSRTSRCPVDLKGDGSSSLSPWWSAAAGKPASTAKPSSSIERSPSSPVCSSSSASIPESLEEAAKYAQTPQPGQTFPLETLRQVSSIPRGCHSAGNEAVEADSSPADDSTKNNQSLPHHQALTPNNDNRWVYPSEQQLYNAMRRKGWDNVPETSIPIVLQIHNAVNESTWQQLLEYHRFSKQPRLVRFQGRPNDLTPKAWFLSTFLGYPKPFDRHDWYVEYYKVSPLSGTDKGQWIQQRYVIDFYENTSFTSTSTARVDVRPALDHPRAVWLSTKRFLQLAFPGITQFCYGRSRRELPNTHQPGIAGSSMPTASEPGVAK